MGAIVCRHDYLIPRDDLVRNVERISINPSKAVILLGKRGKTFGHGIWSGSKPCLSVTTITRVTSAQEGISGTAVVWRTSSAIRYAGLHFGALRTFGVHCLGPQRQPKSAYYLSTGNFNQYLNRTLIVLVGFVSPTNEREHSGDQESPYKIERTGEF
jgi:hypothetical protein